MEAVFASGIHDSIFISIYQDGQFSNGVPGCNTGSAASKKELQEPKVYPRSFECRAG